ncbi:AraC family transcriptional regulator [bacterium LRH843]|nr:AraC family transcriptional regulator [bacterium LRH843]
MNYIIVEREAFHVTGIKQEFPFRIGEGSMEGIPGVPIFWEEANKNGTTNRLTELNSGQIKGLLGITMNYNNMKSVVEYWIATEHLGEVQSGLESLTIPASKWVVFEVHGPIPVAIIQAWRFIHSEWFPSSGYEPAHIPPMEVYLDSDLHSANAYNEIWIPIK